MYYSLPNVTQQHNVQWRKTHISHTLTTPQKTTNNNNNKHNKKLFVRHILKLSIGINDGIMLPMNFFMLKNIRIEKKFWFIPPELIQGTISLCIAMLTGLSWEQGVLNYICSFKIFSGMLLNWCLTRVTYRIIQQPSRVFWLSIFYFSVCHHLPL